MCLFLRLYYPLDGIFNDLVGKNYAICQNTVITKLQKLQFHHARPTGQVIFSVSIDINFSEQKFAKETFKHLPSYFTLILVVFR